MKRSRGAAKRAAPPESPTGWSARLQPADPLLWVRLAVAASMLVFAPGLYEQFEAPKAAVVQVIGLGCLAALIGSGDRGRRFRWQPLDIVVAGWLAIEILSTLGSVCPRLSVLGEVRQREGLLTSLGLAGLYGASRAHPRDAASFRLTLIVILVAAAGAGLYAIVQLVGLDPLPWQGAAIYGEGGRFVRPGGSFGHANLLGVVSAAALATAFPLCLERSGRLRLAGLAGLCGAATLATLSRAAWLGAAAGLFVSGSLAGLAHLRVVPASDAAGDAPGRGRSRWIVAALPAVALTALAALLLIGPVGGVLRARFADLLSPGGGSGRSRIEIWKMAVACWRGRPWLGHGPDTLALMAPRFQTPEYWRLEWASVPLHAHSIYLQALATRGVVGLAAGAAWALALLHAMRRAWSSSAAARTVVASAAGALAALAVAGAFGVLGKAGAVIVVVTSGALAGLAGPGGLEVPASPRSAPGRRGLWLGAAAGALMCFWSAGDLASAGAAFRAWRSVSAPADLRIAAAAAGEADRAAAIRPWEDTYQWLRAEVYVAAAGAGTGADDALDRAEASARRAVSLAPLRALNHRGLGRVILARALRGNRSAIPAGEEEYASCFRLAPYDGLARLELAQVELALGRPRVALQQAQDAARMYPQLGLAHALLASARLRTGDRGGARRALESAVTGDWMGMAGGRRQALRMLDTLRTPALAP